MPIENNCCGIKREDPIPPLSSWIQQPYLNTDG
jgi:hypothetical protein